MSSTRRDRARFDRWTETVARRAEARELSATWSRHVARRDGSIRPLLHAEFVPPDAQVYWVGDYPPERYGGLTWTPTSTAVREDVFVHPSWWHPSPAPVTKRSKRGHPVPSTQLKRAARRYQQEHGVPYTAALRAVRERGQVQQETREEAPMKINTPPRMSGGEELAGTKDAREELEKLVEAEEKRQGGGQ